MNFSLLRWPAVAACLFVLLACESLSAQQGTSAAVPFAGVAGPQTANDKGRTKLPMEVQRSIGFREIGPAITGGRVTAVAGVPGNANVYYVGAADGGVFRTDDGGITWKAEFQHEPVASVGAMALDPQNPNVVWVGTGEANVRNDVSYGDGVYKSTDGGAHWKCLGLKNSFQISRIVIDPKHPDTVLVAAMGSPWADSADRGVYRTTDGGATWTKVLYAGPSVGISDMAMDPKNPQIVFAATYRFRRTPWSYSDGGPEDAIYRSLDGGATWQRLSGHGLPKGPVTRIGLAVAPSEANVVYAVMGSNEGVLWRSDDEGEHWTLVSKNQEVDVRPFYFSHIAVDPKNPDHVFALSNDLMESTDGGKTFHKIAKKIHVDHHAIWIDPDGSGRIIEGNDGGAALSVDNGVHWSFVHNIAIGQFYHVATGQGIRYLVCGGLQDNSSWCGPSRSKDPSEIPSREWFALNGGDGIFAVPAADDPNIIYNSTENDALLIFDWRSQQSRDIEPHPRDFLGGGVEKLQYRFAWDAAFAVSPVNSKVLYAGGNVVFKSEDRGRTWKVISPDLTRNDKAKQASTGGPVIKDNSGAEVYDAILTIAPAPKDPRVIWVGTDDGLVQVTRDGGANWTNVTAHIPGLPPWGRVESIDVSASNAGEALIAVDRHFSGDFAPYLYRTTDYGATWESISGNLPRVYAHVVRQDLRNPRLYYAGLENGLYVSWDAGAHWYLFGLGLPNAAVYDLALDAQNNDLIVATHGRSLWVLDDLTPFQESKPDTTDAHLFPPPIAERFWQWSQTEPMGDGAFYGKNPPYGAKLTYYAPKDVKGPGKLVIKDASGHVVRTLEGEHEKVPDAKKKAKPWVPVKPGLQRIYWDLRADGPVRWERGKDFEKGPKAGALVVPGKYTATLTIGGQTSAQTFEVVNDPDSHATQAEMEDYYQTTEAVLHEMSQVDVALNRMDAIDAQLKALREAAKGSADEKMALAAMDALGKQMDAVKAKITSNPGAAESMLRVPDQLREHLTTLDGLLEGTDTAPTAAMLEQKKRLDGEYQSAIETYNQFIAKDVPAFNQSMASHKLTGVVGGETLKP
ncbi:MAG TPA: hypothetical protein VME86_03275 [Acidobacteriaceae bacterium]|nr:hypothetical protein [Acidobacteriaceae bacterium]